jgi:hypothetical protein
MAARRISVWLGAGAVGLGAYYMYQAGGSPKVAEKQMERKAYLFPLRKSTLRIYLADDAARLSSKVRGELPGKEKEAKTEAKVYAEQAGQKIDRAVSITWLSHFAFDYITNERVFQIDDAKTTTNKVDAKLEGYRANAEKKLDEYRKEAGKDLTSAVDKFDKTVEQKAAQSKSWIGSWFGK